MIVNETDESIEQRSQAQSESNYSKEIIEDSVEMVNDTGGNNSGKRFFSLKIS